MKISENGVHRELTSEEEAKWIADATKAEREEKTRPLTDSEVFRLFAAQSINTLPLDNNTALRCLSYHPTWEDLCKSSYKAEKKGYRFQYAGKLYETVQPEFTFQEQWVPGADGTAAIYSRVEWQHAGTADDPIPVPADVGTNAFTYVTGKIYDEDGTLWLCQREGEEDGVEHSFTNKPSEVPGYFVKVE